ncbi:Folic acid synthesis protein FOL1 [Diplonema papillatum]|nr:Folic acid synthesis protein FOL1 [Diplonema papillatum]
MAETKECCRTAGYRDCVTVEGLVCQAIVGVKEPERLHRQKLIIHAVMYLDTSCCSMDDDLTKTISYATVARDIVRYTEDSKHYLLETLAHGIARLICLNYGVPECKVRVAKPRAIPLADHAVVEIVRARDFFVRERANLLELAQVPAAARLSPAAGESLVFLGLGSNVGSRADNLAFGIAEIAKRTAASGTVVSRLFSSPAAYVTEQPEFANACIGITTKIDPFALLKIAKDIEAEAGRDLDPSTKVVNGPRPLDIDILLVDGVRLDSPTLSVPHAEMSKRLFVLLPLADIAPGAKHPVFLTTVGDMKKRLLLSNSTRVPGEADASALHTMITAGKPADSQGTRCIAVGSKTLVFSRVSTAEDLELVVASSPKDNPRVAVVAGDDESRVRAMVLGFAGGLVACEPTTAAAAVALLKVPGLAGCFLPHRAVNDPEALSAVAKLAAESRCFLVVPPDTSPSAVWHITAQFGVLPWQLVASPLTFYAAPGDTPAAAASKQDALQTFLRAPCGAPASGQSPVPCSEVWDLTRLPVDAAGSLGSLAALLTAAVSRKADIVIANARDTAGLLQAAETADTLFCAPWSHR